MTEHYLPPLVANGDFARWLRETMAARRMTMRMLALRAGVDRSTISRIVNDTRDPKLSTALALLRILETQPMQVASRDSKVDSQTAA